jgi:glycosyltransferase involved in cell wall biosynthesis
MAANGVKGAFLNKYISAFRVHGKQASVGGDFVKTGIAFQEHLALLERYITEEYYNLFSGYEAAILNTFLGKLEQFKLYSLEFSQIFPALQSRVELVQQSLALFNQRSQETTLKPFMSKTPLVSVIMPTKDREKLLVEAIASIGEQTYSNWEVIVINDGGEDISSILAAHPQSHKIRYLDLRQNKGQSHARNIGISLASGEVICFLDDDDVFLPNHLEVIVAGLENSNFAFTQTEMVVLDQQGNHIDKSIAYEDVMYSRERLLVENFIPINTWGVRKSHFLKVGVFKETLDCLEDWELLLRISENTEVNQVKQVTVRVYMREHLNGVTVSNRSNFPEVFREVYASHADVSDEVKVLRKRAIENIDKVYARANISSSQVKTISTRFNISAKTASLVSLTLEFSKLIDGHLFEFVAHVYESLEANQELTDYLSTITSLLVDEEIEDRLLIRKKVALYTQLSLLSLKFENRADPKLMAMRALLSKQREQEMYGTWRHNHALLEVDAQLHAERLMTWKQQPRFHFIMLMYEGQQHLLANTIDALSRQLYGNWKLTVIGDGEAPDPLFDEVDVLEWVSFPDGADLYPFLNGYIQTVIDDWFLFIPAGTEFEAHFLLKLGDYINHQQEKVVFYFDDDIIEPTGNYANPRFKPDFNLDLLRSSDYVGVVACQPDLFKRVEGFDAVPAYENMSITFKAFERLGAAAIGHIDDVLIHLPEREEFENSQVFKQVIHNHLLRSGVAAQVADGFLPNTARVTYYHEHQPKVSIIIPTKDKLEYLKPCIDSVLTKTSYTNLEILVVDNQSESPDTFEYFDEITLNYADKLTLLSYPYPFNYAAIINTAVKKATGEYLVLLNNDTEILQSDWIERMLMHAQRPEVGAVGVRLVYPETALIQHAGVVIGMNSTADHPYNGYISIEEPGYMGRAQLDQNYSAVTAACLMISKVNFYDVQGMDDVDFAVNFNDVDMCLKLIEKGFVNVWTPYVTLIHHGSVSQKSMYKRNEKAWKERFELAQKENSNFFKKWKHICSRDPAYNRHLQLSSSDVHVEYEIPGNWDTNFHERTRVLGLPLSGGSGEYRVIHPFRALSQAALAQCEYYRFGRDQSKPINIAEYARLSPDAVVFQAAINDGQLQQIEGLKTYLPEIKRIYTVDDLLTNVPEKSPVYKEIQRNFKDSKSRLRQALASCDRLIVSTEPLAELSKGLIEDIRVIPNRLPRDTWCHLVSKRQQADKPRVGWAGAQQHHGDLAIITDVVKELADEVDWVFMGMCPEELHPYIKEFHPFISIDDYPEKLASLNLDLALAPLEQHPFNESKSNLRLLEYGVLGWPVIATDIYPYRTNNPPITIVQNDSEQWLTAIKSLLADKKQLYAAGDNLKQWVLDNYILEDHLDEWLSALTD